MPNTVGDKRKRRKKKEERRKKKEERRKKKEERRKKKEERGLLVTSARKICEEFFASFCKVADHQLEDPQHGRDLQAEHALLVDRKASM